MKEIIALKEYTDKYVSLYEGQIRNIEDGIANKLIEEGIVAEHGDSEGGGEAASGETCIVIELEDNDGVQVRGWSYNGEYHYGIPNQSDLDFIKTQYSQGTKVLLRDYNGDFTSAETFFNDKLKFISSGYYYDSSNQNYIIQYHIYEIYKDLTSDEQCGLQLYSLDVFADRGGKM